MNTAPKIIGLAGTFASGKDTLAHHLVAEYNFLHVSTGDMIRQEAFRLRGSTERPVLHEVANQLRGADGPDIFVRLALETFRTHAEKYDGLVVSGLRSVGEAEAVKKAGGTLVFVDAPVEIRYRRMTSRQRDDETQLTFEQFKSGEAKELENATNDPAAQNLHAIQKMADVQLRNANDLDGFVTEGTAKLGLS